MVIKNKFFSVTIILLVFSIILSINFVSASHIVNFSSGELSITVNEDVTNFFNITINNSDLGPAANITEVNITLWGNFNFDLNTNNTNAKSVFSNTSTVLNWRNNTYVVNGTQRKYFWFNATATTPGTYNITITTVNRTNTYSSNLSITVNDTTTSVIYLIEPVDSTSSTITSYNFTFNVTDSSTISNCSLIFDNSVINVLTNINNTGGAMGMYNSSLSVGVHTWNISCADSFNNIANSSSRILNITAPVTETTSGGGGVAPEWTSTKVLSDVEFSSGIIKELRARERVKTNVGGTTHYIGIKAISENSVMIELTSTPQTATMNVAEEKSFDVNNDGYYDILVKLNSITNNIANVYIKSVNELIYVKPTAPPEPATPVETDSSQPLKTATLAETRETSWIFWIVIIIVIIIAIILVIYYFDRQRKKNFYIAYKRKRR